MSECNHKAGHYFNFDGVKGCVACKEARIAELEAALFGLKEKAWLLVLSAELDSDVSVVDTADLEALAAELRKGVKDE
jgi:hypothetical protein